MLVCINNPEVTYQIEAGGYMQMTLKGARATESFSTFKSTHMN